MDIAVYRFWCEECSELMCSPVVSDSDAVSAASQSSSQNLTVRPLAAAWSTMLWLVCSGSPTTRTLVFPRVSSHTCSTTSLSRFAGTTITLGEGRVVEVSAVVSRAGEGRTVRGDGEANCSRSWGKLVLVDGGSSVTMDEEVDRDGNSARRPRGTSRKTSARDSSVSCR